MVYYQIFDTYRREFFVRELMVTDVVYLRIEVGYYFLRAPTVYLEFEVCNLIEVLTAHRHLRRGRT